MDRAKYPECYEETLKKARKVIEEDIDSFYNVPWYELLEKYPKLCSKIEEARMGSASTEEFNALRKQVEELSLIVQELWEHRVRGKPKE